MDSLLERINRGELWQIPGGIHPEQNKAQTNQLPIETLALPEQLVLPVKQHIGAAGKLLVKAGDKVLKGEALTKPTANWSVPVHAPTSGTIIEITSAPSAHPSALPELSIILKPDGEDTWCTLVPHPNYQQLPPERIVDIIHYAGIAGMGGAGFPTYIKAAAKQEIDVLIVNGAECEPYISADDVLMQAHSEEIKRGIDILVHLLQPKMVLVGIEDDKPQAIKAMTDACASQSNYHVRAVPTKYPSGGEKQLIQILTSKEVPTGSIPADVGVMVQNVGTVFAIQQALELGKPLIERVVTVTGDTIGKPSNVWALLGTPVKHVLQQRGFEPEAQQRVIMGGPMMGFTLPTVRIPVVKTTNCLLAPSSKEMPFASDEQACIRCSACADACPASLLPQQLQWFAKAKEYDKLQEHALFDCIECGACAYVCPSEIPLVQYYRVAKAEIREQQIEQVKSDRAKERFEARKERLAREQEERRNRHKRPRRSAKEAEKTDDKVAEALARVNAKKAAQGDEKDKVAAAIARAKAKKQGTDEPDNSEVAKQRALRKEQAKQYKEQKQQESQSNTATSDDSASDKKAAVAAAIARAKAKKAAQQNEQSGEAQTSDANAPAKDDKKAAVAAAIARAKAKKAAAQAEQSEAKSEPEAQAESKSAEQTPEDKKKAAVAAAVARAKAKKAAAQAEQSEAKSEPETQAKAESTEQTPEEKKKAAVAAAIARAKAKKAAAQAEQNEAASEPETQANSENAEQTPEEKKKAAVAAAIARAKAKKAAAQAEQAKNNDQEDPS